MKVFPARIFILVLFILTAVFVFAHPSYFGGQSATVLGSSSDKLLTVAFLDVGQGDSIYIETFDGLQMLIDGGPDNTVLRELPKQLSLWDRDLDLVLATHPDKDHIGGLIDVLKRYEVGKIITTENVSDSAVSGAFSEAVKNETTDILLARAGQVLQLGASTSIAIFSPASDPTSWESNTSSIVLQLRFGEIEFMFTGDATVNIEEYLSKTYGDVLESEVLKLGHHGSRTATADLFLDVVMPEYAVVSAGRGNSYGHPHTEVVDKVSEREINLLSTADSGTVVFKSDGKRVWLE